MQDFVKKLSKEERKALKDEIREAKRQAYLKKHNHGAAFDIAKRFFKRDHGTCQCQVLRSSCNWSTGLRRVENSILNAYVENIYNAEKFIFIENQFFISNAGHGGVVKNTITKALKERIIRAHKEGTNFKVYIFIPLMPGFEGDIVEKDSQVLKLQIRFQQETIVKGPNSLYTTLRREGINCADYIRFYGLRNHDVFDDGPKQDMIYIHSKCIIVDDRVLIMGSANINDRSMLGSRDSEVCVLVQDEDMVESTLDGEPFMVGKAVHDFRKKVMGRK